MWKEYLVINRKGWYTNDWSVRHTDTTNKPPGVPATRAPPSGSGRPGTYGAPAASPQTLGSRRGLMPGRRPRDPGAQAGSGQGRGSGPGLQGPAGTERHELCRRSTAPNPARPPSAERPSGCAPGLPIPRGLRRLVPAAPPPGPSSSSFLPQPAPPRVNPGRPPPLLPPPSQPYWPASPHHTAAVAPPHTAPRFHLPLCGRPGPGPRAQPQTLHPLGRPKAPGLPHH